MLTLRDTPSADRPREQLNRQGVEALSDEALLAVLLGTGTRGRDVLRVAREVIALIDLQGTRLTPKELQRVSGVGAAKSALLVAALEFARRRIRPRGDQVRMAEDVYRLIRHFADRVQEHFLCLSLNGAHEVLNIRVVTIGLLNATQVHPREVFADAILDRAAAVIVAHNHPSGQLEPSAEDRAVTKNLMDAGKLLGVRLLDHLIFTRDGFYSFAERGEFVERNFPVPT